MIRNLAEESVERSVTSLRPHFPTFCGCDICEDDVRVFALNRVPQRYVSSLEGNAVVGVALSRDDQRAATDVAVMEAYRKVAAAPRCGRTRTGG